MSEVKRYYVGKYGLVEGEALGRLNVVLSADYDAALAREASLQQLLNEKDQRLDEAVAVVSAQEWQWKPYDDHYHRECGYYCPCCGVEEGSEHESSCDIGSFLAVAALPDDTCAHSHANKLGCPECGEEFSGDEVKP